MKPMIKQQSLIGLNSFVQKKITLHLEAGEENKVVIFSKSFHSLF